MADSGYELENLLRQEAALKLVLDNKSSDPDIHSQVSAVLLVVQARIAYIRTVLRREAQPERVAM